jgi:hypothetical protein
VWRCEIPIQAHAILDSHPHCTSGVATMGAELWVQGCRAQSVKSLPKSCPLTRVRTPPQVFRKIQCPCLVAHFGVEHFHFRSKKERSNLTWS